MKIRSKKKKKTPRKSVWKSHHLLKERFQINLRGCVDVSHTGKREKIMKDGGRWTRSGQKDQLGHKHGGASSPTGQPYK